MFYLMRELPSGTIYPCREDPHNQNGGYWTSKINTEHAMEVWKKLCFLMVNETVVEDWQKINGVSITPKQGFCLVKIWNGKDDNSDISQLKMYLSNFLDLNACMYFNNKIKIAIDSRRHGGRDSGRGRGRGRPDRGDRDRKRAPIRRNMPSQSAFQTSSGFQGMAKPSTWRDLLQTQGTKPSFQTNANTYVPPNVFKPVG